MQLFRKLIVAGRASTNADIYTCVFQAKYSLSIGIFMAFMVISVAVDIIKGVHACLLVNLSRACSFGFPREGT